MSSLVDPKVLAAIPLYNGVGLFTDYIEKFNHLLSMFRLTEAEAYIILPSRLIDRADLAYQAIKNMPQCRNYQSLINEINKKLNSDGRKATAKAKLSEKMIEGESLMEFATRIRKLVIEGYPELHRNNQEVVMAESFRSGLSPKLQERIGLKSFNTLQEAFTEAENQMTFIRLHKADDLERKVEELTRQINEYTLRNANTVNYISQSDEMRNIENDEQYEGYHNGGYNPYYHNRRTERDFPEPHYNGGNYNNYHFDNDEYIEDGPYGMENPENEDEYWNYNDQYQDHPNGYDEQYNDYDDDDLFQNDENEMNNFEDEDYNDYDEEYDDDHGNEDQDEYDEYYPNDEEDINHNVNCSEENERNQRRREAIADIIDRCYRLINEEEQYEDNYDV